MVALEILALLVLVVIGALIILLLGALLFFLPAIVVSAIVWWISGNPTLTGVAFLAVALVSLLKRRR